MNLSQTLNANQAMQRNGGRLRVDMDTLLPPSADGGRSAKEASSMDAYRIYEIARSVSKNGDLGSVSEDTIEWARTLTESDKIDLYCQIRDESLRQESEWRDEFMTRVEIAGSALPEAADETVNIADFLKWAADHKDRGEVMDTLDELLENARDDEIELAKQIIVQTSQEDLLPILEEFAE